QNKHRGMQEMDKQASQYVLPVLPVLPARSQSTPCSTPASRPVPMAPPQVTMTAVTRRLRMLLVDRVGEQGYVFDPESADIMLVPPPVEYALKAVQAGEQLSEDLLEGLVDLLNLDPVEDAATTVNYSQWGITIHLNHACNLACEYCYAD